MSRTRLALLLATTAGAAMLAGAAMADPVVAPGSPPVDVTIAQTGGNTVVTQTGDRVVIDWTSFNIANGQSVDFRQPGATSIAFNRIANLSTIDGSLTANGQVWLFSPGGLIFGANARVNVGALVASTGDIDIDDATGPDNSVAVTGGAGSLTVQPGAQITSVDYTVLHAPTLTQNGAVSAGSNVALIAADGMTLTTTSDQSGRNLIAVSGVGAATGQAVLSHGGETRSGTATAPGAIAMTASGGMAGENGFASVINLAGTVQALSVVSGDTTTGGSVMLQAQGGLVQSSAAETRIDGDTTINAGDVRLGALEMSNSLLVNATSAILFSGRAHVNGSINASTANGLGDIVVNGDLVAAAEVVLRSSQDITIASGVTIQADSDGIASDNQRIEMFAVRDVLGAGSTLLGGSSITNLTSDITISAGSGGEGGAGGDIELGALYGSDITLDAYSEAVQFFPDEGPPISVGRGGAITVGALTASGNAIITNHAVDYAHGGLIRLTGSATVGGYLQISNFDSGDLQLDANASANESVSLTAQDIRLADGITVRSDADGLQGGDLNILAIGSLLGADADLATGLAGGAATADIDVSAGQAEGGGPGGNIEIRGLRGGNVTLTAAAGGDETSSFGGNIDIFGPVLANGTLGVTTRGFSYFAMIPDCECGQFVTGVNGGHIRFASTAPVSAGGITIENANGGDIDINADLLSDAGVSLTADRDITVAPGLTIQADRDLAAEVGEIMLEAGRDVLAGGATLLGGAYRDELDENDQPVTYLYLTAPVTVTGGSFDRDVGPSAGNVELGTVIGRTVSVQTGSNSLYDPDTDEETGLYGGAITINGAVISGGDVAIYTEARGSAPNLGAITVGGVFAGGGVDIENFDLGDVVLNGDINAYTYVLVRSSANVTLADGITVRADADGADTTGEPETLEIHAMGDVIGRLANLATGTASGDPTTDITVMAGEQLLDSAAPGGSIEIGGLRGGLVTLGARANGDGVSDAIGGSIGVYGDVTTTSDFFATANYDSFSSNGVITFGDGVTARIGGMMQLTNVNLGGLVIGAGADLEAVDNVSLVIDGSILADATSRIASSDGDVDIQAGRAFLPGSDITLGDLFGREIVIHTSLGDITLSGTTRALADLTVNGGFGTATTPSVVTVDGDVSADGQVNITNFDGHILIGQGVTIQSDADGDGLGGNDGQTDGGLYLTASQNITAGAGSMLLAGASLAELSADVSVVAGAGTLRFSDPPGGDLTVHGAAGQNVYLSATAGEAGLGNVFVRGNLTGADLVQIETLPFVAIVGCQCEGLTGGEQGPPAGSVNIDPGVVIHANADGDSFGGIIIRAYRDVVGDPTSLLLSGAAEDDPSGDIAVAAGYVNDGFQAGGSITLGRAIGGNIGIEADAGELGGGSVSLLGDMSALNDILVFAYGHAFTDPETEDDVFNVGDITIGAGVTLRGNADGDINGGIGIYGDRNVTAAASSLLVTGAVGGPAVGDVEMYAGESAAEFGLGGGNLTTGRITADNIILGASTIDQGGGITVGGALTAVNDVLIANRIVDPNQPCDCAGSPPGGQGAPPLPPAVSILADITAGDDIDIGSIDEIYIEMGVTIRANDNGDAVGGLSMLAALSINALAGSNLGAGAVGFVPVGDVTIIAGYPVPRVNAVGGNLVTDGVFGGDVTLEANAGAGSVGSATINGPVDAGNLDVTADDFVRLGNTTSRGYVHGTAGTNFTITGAVAAAADVTIDAQTGQIALDPGASVRSDSDGAGGGALTLRASGNIAMGAGSLIATGASGGPATTDATLIAGQAFGLGGPDAGDLVLADARVNNLVLTANRAGLLGGALQVTGNATAAGNISGSTFRSVTLGAGAVLRADADGAGGGDLLLDADGAITGAADSLLVSGAVGLAGTGTVQVRSGLAGAGGDLVLGSVTAGTVTLIGGTAGLGNANIQGMINAGTGSVSAAQTATVNAISATGGFTATGATGVLLSGPINTGGAFGASSSGGGVTVNGAVTSQSSAAFTAQGTGSNVAFNANVTAATTVLGSSSRGAITIGNGVTLRGDSGGVGAMAISLLSSGDITLGAGALLTSGLTGGTPTGDITLIAGNAFGSGGPDAGNLTFTDAAIAGRTTTLTARRIGAVGGVINAGSASATQLLTLTGYDVNLAATSVLRGDSDGVGTGGLTITATHDVNGAAGSLAASGASGAGRGALSVTAGAGGAGGSLTLGAVMGGDLTLTSIAGAGGAGDLTVLGAVTAIGTAALDADRNLTVGGPLITGGDATLTAGGTASVGTATSGAAFNLSANGDVTLGGPVTTTDFLVARSASGTLTVNGALVAGTDMGLSGAGVALNASASATGDVEIESTTADVLVNALVRADADSLGGGDLTIIGARNVTATAQLRTGAGTGAGTGDVSVTAGTVSGGNAVLASVIAGDIDVLAYQYAGNGGGITINGPLAAVSNITLHNDVLTPVVGSGPSGGLAAPPLPPAISILADMTAGDDINVTSIDAIYVETGVTVRANNDGDPVGALTFHAARNIDLLAGSRVGAGASGSTPVGAVEIIAGYPAPRANAVGGNLLAYQVFGGAVRLEAHAGAGAAGNATVNGLVDAANLDMTADGFGVLGATTSRGYVHATAGTDFTLAGALSAAAEITVDAQRGTLSLSPGAIVRADSDGNGVGALTLRASGNLVMGAGSQIATGLSGGAATTDITLTAGQAFGLGGPDAGNLTFTSVTGRNVALTARRSGAVGGVINAGSATATEALTLTGYDVNLVATSILRGDSDGVGAGGLTITATHDIVGAAGSLLASGQSGGTGRGLITVLAGAGGAGGSATLGAVNGGSADLRALGGAGGVGDLTVIGATTASTGSVTANAARNLALTGALSAGTSATLVAGGSANVGAADTGGAFDLAAGGDVLLSGPITAGGALSARSTGGGLTSNGALTSGSTLLASAGGAAGLRVNAGASANGDATLRATAGGITLGSGATVRADADGSGSGVLLVQASGDILADPASLLVTGSASGLPTTNITVTAGGNLTLGGLRSLNAALSGQAINIAGDASALQSIGITGSSLTLGSGGVLRADADANGSGGFTLAVTGNITGAATSLIAVGTDANPTGLLSLSSSAGSLTLGRLSAGLLTLSAPSATGRITLLGTGVGVNGIDIFAGGGIRVAGLSAANGAIGLRTGGDVAVSAGSIVNGVTGVTVDAGTLVSVEDNAIVAGGYGSGAPGAATWPNAPSPLLGGVRVTAADIDLRGRIHSYVGATGLGDVFIAIRNAGTSAVLGGDTGAGGFHLSNSEFGRVLGRNVVITAGQLNAPSGDLTVRDLTLADSGPSGLWLGASGVIRITGSISAPGTATPEVRIGFLLPTFVTTGGNAAQFAPGPQSATAGFAEFVPSSVTLTGTLGGDGGLGQVGIVARGDVLIGDNGFVTEASSASYRPRSSNAAGTGRIQIHALGLQFATTGRILQQNTGNTATFAGLRIGAPTADRPLITWFGFLGATPTPPSIIDLYGAIQQADGTYLADRRAADTPHLLSSSLTVIDDYKFNTCTFGRAASCGFTPTFQDPFTFTDFTWFDQPSDLLTILLYLPDADEEEERLYIGVPITGTGNEDLWFGTDREPGR